MEGFFFRLGQLDREVVATDLSADKSSARWSVGRPTLLLTAQWKCDGRMRGTSKRSAPRLAAASMPWSI